MLFDKTFVLEAIKGSLNVGERAQKKKQDIALLACLDDLSLRLQSDSHLSVEEIPVTGSSREIKVDGANFDLNSIYYIRLELGSEKAIVEFKDQKLFIKEFDTLSTNSPSMPTYFTYLTVDDGFPVLRFSSPLISGGTMFVYYLQTVTPESISQLSNVSPIIQGTLAYFLGIETSRGNPYYNSFKELVALMKSTDSFMMNPESRIDMNKFDLSTKQIQGTISRSRN